MSNIKYQSYPLTTQSIAGELQKVKRIGPGKYFALCPANDDKTLSLSIQDTPSGKVLVHCLACPSKVELINAPPGLGLWYEPPLDRNGI